MSRRTYSYNAFTSQLSSPIASGSVSIALNSTTGLQAPCYLVIEPDSLTKREYIKVSSISAPTLQDCTRGLAGSVAGAQAHDAGVEVRAVMVHQIIDDIFQDIIELESDGSSHYGGIDLADHPEATDTSRGFMSASDKEKLDDIEENAKDDMTPGEILDALLEVDGPNSGLSVQYLNNLEGDEYSLEGHAHAGYAAASHDHDDWVAQHGSWDDPKSGWGALTGSWTTKDSMSFVPPGSWGTYEITVWGTVACLATSMPSEARARIVIGGSNGSAMYFVPQLANTQAGVPMSHKSSGRSGSITLELEIVESAGDCWYGGFAGGYIATRLT